MARNISITSDFIINKSIEYIIEYGIDLLNARDLAKYIGCSTQPIFKNFINMDDLKKNLRNKLHDHYDDFIYNIVDKNNYLLTISYAYAMYAKKYPNAFKALFISSLAGSRTIDEVINSSWNRETIESMIKEYNISLDKAKKVYRDVRFYTHGIACQLSINSIIVNDNDLYNLIDNNIKNNLKG